MVDDADQNVEPDWLRNLPLRSEEIGFAPDELVVCTDCGKPNAPNRGTCLYCGATREGFAGDEKLELRELEDWENGFNVVLLDTGGADVEKASDVVAAMISGEREFLKTAFESGKNIPIMRATSDELAQRVSQKLDELGISSVIVKDADLKVTSLPVRLRSIAFEDDQLILELFNIDEFFTVPIDKLVLIVAGMIFEDRHESVERRSRKGTKMLNEMATSSDEPLIDIYSTTDPLGWRIPASGFDFSCLGSEKSLIVAENMKKLVAKLAQALPGARLVDDYTSLRSLLEVAWPSDVKRDGKIVAMGKKDFSTVFTTNNAAQFMKYSRMQWRLLYEEKV